MAADRAVVVEYHKGQIILAIAVVLLGTALAYGTYLLPVATGYAQIGPRLMSAIVAGGLVLLGFVLLKEALTGGFRGVDESEHVEMPTHWAAFGWISAGLILNGLLIVPIGFVIAGTLLFTLSARGFGSTAYVRNAVVGFIIAALTYAFFNYGLGLVLPPGILPI